jgi:hypothetical protein
MRTCCGAQAEYILLGRRSENEADHSPELPDLEKVELYINARRLTCDRYLGAEKFHT